MINLETNKVTDFKIDEGTLQEAFLQVLGENRGIDPVDSQAGGRQS